MNMNKKNQNIIKNKLYFIANLELFGIEKHKNCDKNSIYSTAISNFNDNKYAI